MTADVPGFSKTATRAYFCVLEVAVGANRCSIIQGCRICNYVEEDGNSSYPPTPLNASIMDDDEDNDDDDDVNDDDYSEDDNDDCVAMMTA